MNQDEFTNRQPQNDTFVFIPRGNTTSRQIYDTIERDNIPAYISENGRVKVDSSNAILARELLEKTDLEFTYGS